MSQDIPDARTHSLWVRAFVVCGLVRVVGRWAGSRGWVEGAVAEQLAGGGAYDASVLDEEQDVGFGVSSADAVVVQPAGQAQGEAAGLIDLVGADAARTWVWRSAVGPALGRAA